MIKTAERTFAIMLLALGIAATQSSAVYAQPPVWESQNGATLPGQALDNVNDGIVNLTFGSMSFPFEGKTYTGADILNISSNGFISLGGDNGNGCCDGDPTALVQGAFPRIAPLGLRSVQNGAMRGKAPCTRTVGSPSQQPFPLLPPRLMKPLLEMLRISLPV